MGVISLKIPKPTSFIHFFTRSNLYDKKSIVVLMINNANILKVLQFINLGNEAYL